MLRLQQRVKRLALAGCAAALMSGCAVHARYYDPVYSDYHVWGPPEAGYYNRWLVETHHRHMEYRRLRPEEQRQYWTWRHGHPDRH